MGFDTIEMNQILSLKSLVLTILFNAIFHSWILSTHYLSHIL